MASVIYLSCPDDNAKGNIDFDTDTFYAMITTSAYTENKTTHAKRSDVTGEITGTGYTAGGVAVTVTVTKDTANNRIDISLGGFTISSSTITGRKVVYYKRRGGAASADELVACIDLGADVVSVNGNWTQAASTLRRTIP